MQIFFKKLIFFCNFIFLVLKITYMFKNFVIFSFSLIVLLSFSIVRLNSQCGCSSGQQFSPPLHWLGTSETALSERKRLRIEFLYRFFSSNRLYNADSYKSGLVDFKSHFLNLFASYGLDAYTSFDFDISYSVRSLYQYGFRSKGYGFSSASLGLRRNIYETETSDFISNLGLGFRFPLMKFQDIENHPVVIQPSDGSFGLYAMAFAQKSFPQANLNLLLFVRFDYQFENSLNYFFGPNLLTSFLLSKRFSDNFYSIVELRNQIHFKDKFNDSTYTNSGAKVLELVPRITFLTDEFSVSPFFELPIYQFYEGEQIGKNFALGINFNYILNFARRKIE